LAVGCSILPVLAQAPEPAVSGQSGTGIVNKPGFASSPLYKSDPLTVWLASPPLTNSTEQLADRISAPVPEAAPVASADQPSASATGSTPATVSNSASSVAVDTASGTSYTASEASAALTPESVPVSALNVPLATAHIAASDPAPDAQPAPTPASDPEPGVQPVPASDPEPIPAAPAIPVKPDKPARIPVLNYHSITVDPGNRATITPKKFEEQMRYLHENGYNTLTLKQFSDMMEGIDKGPDKPVLITFDDGYMDNYEHGMPILKELGFHATLFMSPGMVDDGYFLNWDQVKEMHEAGWDIQPHGMTHPHLPKLNAKDQAYQISEAKAQIEQNLGTVADVFCYPYGQWNATTLRLLKELNFRYAFTIEQGMTAPSQEKLKLKRIFVNGEESIEQWKSKFEK
jgi:peptidoglycan/xylan/chitin deacetylase (PgdA/CDA1 family)